jgi:MarR family transcriptional regulator for hemolysin
MSALMSAPRQPGRSTQDGPAAALGASTSQAADNADDASTLAACATRLVSVAPLLMREFRAEMRRSAPADLSVPVFRALILAGSRPGATVSDLANHLGVTLPTASVAVTKLAARGLLQPTTPGERPSLLLTPAGAEMVHRARSDATSAFERRLGGLAPDALRQIDAALVALDAALAAGAQGARVSGIASGRRQGQAKLAAKTVEAAAAADQSRSAATPRGTLPAPPTVISPGSPADAATAAEQGATA